MTANRGKITVYTNESVDVAIPEGLKRRGVKAWSTKDEGNLGLADEKQLKFAIRRKAAIFTHDDDFLSLVVNCKREHYGVIYVHQQTLQIGECIRRLKALVQTKTPNEMENRIEFL